MSRRPQLASLQYYQHSAPFGTFQSLARRKIKQKGPSPIACARQGSTLQVGVVVPDDVIGQHAHKRQLVSAAHGGQLEAAKAHKAGRHPAHYSARLQPRIAAAQALIQIRTLSHNGK